MRRKGKRCGWRRYAVLILLLLLTLLFVYVHRMVSPMVGELASVKVGNRASNVINAAIEAQLQEQQIDYNRIISLEKDGNGTVCALKTNINEINRLKTRVLSVIDELLLEMDVEEIGLPLGSLFLPELFSGAGPRLPVRVLSVSSSDADFNNEFSAAGINQTAHRIVMTVSITMSILTPVGTQSVTVSSDVVVAETVIVGHVPESYVNIQPEG